MQVKALAYNLLDLTTAVQDDLKDPSFSSSRIARYLNRGQTQIFNTHRFKFCEKAVTGVLTIGEYTYEQQADHQTTIGGILVDPALSTHYVVLDNENYSAHRDFFFHYPAVQDAPNGMPSSWTEYGNQIYFDRPADKAYIFRQRYYRTPTAMSAGTDVPDVPEGFRELLEFYALYRSEKYRGNHDVAATYKQDFEDGLESMGLRYGSATLVGPHTMTNYRTRTYD